MTISHEPQLFGAQADFVEAATLSHCHIEGDRWRTDVVVSVHNRREMMRLTIWSINGPQLHNATGRLVPVMMRTGTMSPSLARRTLWALHNTFGEMGFEVSIAHCGRDPKG